MMTSVSHPQHVFGKSGFMQNPTKRPQSSTLREDRRETYAREGLGWRDGCRVAGRCWL